MSKKPQDSTDELLRALRASLDHDDEGADERESPEDVFTDHAHGRNRAADEEQAAFDAYMASLLGEVDAPTEARQKKKSPSKAKKAAPTAKAPEAPAETPAEEPLAEPSLAPVILMPEEAEEEPLPLPTALEIAPTEDGMVEFIEEPEQQSLTDAAEALETEPETASEQLALSELPTQPVTEEPLEAVAAEEEETPDAAEEPFPVANAAKEGSLPDYLPIEGLAPPVEEEVPEEQDPTAWREGDLLLDADDETIAIAPAAEQAQASAIQPSEVAVTATPPAAKEPQSEAPAEIMPVSSPLDAVRMANLAAMDTETPQPKQSPLDRMAADRAGARGNVAVVGEASLQDRNGRDRAMTDEDIELLLELGYENHLNEKLGDGRVAAVKNRRCEREIVQSPGRLYGYTGEEYSGHAQDKEIRASYRKQGSRASLCLLLTLLLTALVALVDLFPLVRDGLELPEALLAILPTGAMYALLGSGLLLVMAVLSVRSLWRAVVSLFDGAPTPATIPVLLLAAIWLYDLAGLLVPTPLSLLHLPVALSLLFLTIANRIRLRTEKEAFAVVSAHSRKIVLEGAEAKKKKVIRQGRILKIIDDDADHPLWRVRPAEQIEGYFARTGQPTRRDRLIAPLLAGAFLLSLLLALTMLFVKNDGTVAATAMLLGLQLMLPLSAGLAYVYPMWLATDRLSRRGIAIVGESAVEEYAKEGSLLFDDTEMFRSKSSTEITIKGNGDAKKYIRYAKRLFCTLGGTLRAVTTSDLSEQTYEERVEILHIWDEGLEARMDGKVRVLVGTSAFMVKNGIRVPGEGAEVLVRRHVESCILYLAFDGKLRLGYEVDYRISGRFEQMVASLARDGVAVAIETVDPDIHEEFLARSRRPGLSPIRIIKPLRFQREPRTDRVDSGLVATRSARDIAQAVMACHRVADNDRQMSHLLRISLLSGAIASGAMLLWWGLRADMALIAAAFQLLWCLPMLLITRKNILNEQDQESENDNRN